MWKLIFVKLRLRVHSLFGASIVITQMIEKDNTQLHTTRGKTNLLVPTVLLMNILAPNNDTLKAR